MTNAEAIAAIRARLDELAAMIETADGQVDFFDAAGSRELPPDDGWAVHEATGDYVILATFRIGHRGGPASEPLKAAIGHAAALATLRGEPSRGLAAAPDNIPALLAAASEP
jgi:hypothetical protein